MGLFNINWRTQVTNLLPVFKRSLSMIDFLSSLVQPLQTLSDDEWNDFDVEIRKRSKFNSQIIVLRGALNNIFGVVSPPFIYIETTLSLARITYIYNDNEGFLPVYVYNDYETSDTYVFNDTEVVDGATNFIVWIPIGIHTAELETRVRNEVETYKLAGMSFKIDTF